MLRIIDMAEATGMEGNFAVWNTVIDRFLEGESGQDWVSTEEFARDGFDAECVERVKTLLAGREAK
jgi:hypothetical protein